MKKITTGICILAIGAGLMAFKPTKKEALKLLPKVAKEGFSYIAQGNVYINRKASKVDAFFISKYEVTNAQYMEFLGDLAKNGKAAELKIAMIDSTKWNALDFFTPDVPNTFLTTAEKEKLNKNAKHNLDGVYQADTSHSATKGWYSFKVNSYHRHPAYASYPVVNITYEAAVLYCEWLAEKMNSTAGNNVKYFVRLPSREQWIRAAQGDVKDGDLYAWGTPFLNGNYVSANFKPLGSTDIHYNEELKKYEVITSRIILTPVDKPQGNLTCDVKAYYPNNNGLYNMNGNVAEMVAEKNTAVGGSWHSTGYDIRNESTVTYTDASPLIGFRPIIMVSTN